MNSKPPTPLQKFHSTLAGLWDGSSVRLGTELSRLEKFAHFWVLVARSFSRNRCPARASALAYATLLALIPMLAVALSFTSSLLKGESEEKIDQFIEQLVESLIPPAAPPTNGWLVLPGTVAPQGEPDAALPEAATPPPGLTNPVPATEPARPAPAAAGAPSLARLALASLARQPGAAEARKEAARHIKRFLDNTRSGTLGVTGSIALVFIAITMLGRIEDAFNDIWGVARGRTWLVRVVLYWSVITLAPLLLIGTLALATGPHLAGTRALLARTPFIGNLMFQCLPVVVLWLAFAAFYKLVPNTKVHWAAALAGGLVCAVLWHLNNTVSVLYVSRVVTNSKIYGSLGLVPVFMVGLYFSWLILLLGAQFAYAWQNRAAYLQEKLAERIDQRGREFIALRLMACVGQHFQNGQPAPTVSELSATLGVPSRLTQQIMRTLGAAQLVSEVAGPETAYLPARPLESITCHDILLAMRATGSQPLPRREEPATREVLGEFERIQAAERQAAAAVSLLALVHRTQARLQLAAPDTSAAALRSARPAAVAVPELPPVEPYRASAPPPAAAASARCPQPATPTASPGTAPCSSGSVPSQPTPDEDRSFPL